MCVAPSRGEICTALAQPRRVGSACSRNGRSLGMGGSCPVFVTFWLLFLTTTTHSMWRHLWLTRRSHLAVVRRLSGCREAGNRKPWSGSPTCWVGRDSQESATAGPAVDTGSRGHLPTRRATLAHPSSQRDPPDGLEWTSRFWSTSTVSLGTASPTQRTSSWCWHLVHGDRPYDGVCRGVPRAPRRHPDGSVRVDRLDAVTESGIARPDGKPLGAASRRVRIITGSAEKHLSKLGRKNPCRVGEPNRRTPRAFHVDGESRGRIVRPRGHSLSGSSEPLAAVDPRFRGADGAQGCGHVAVAPSLKSGQVRCLPSR